jgi:hypothetical protein
MLVPSISLASSDDEALRGLLLSTLTAMMKASKTNSVQPVSHFFRERLGRKEDRRSLNRALFAITTALAKKKVGGPQANAKRGAVLDNVMVSKTKFTSLLLLEAMIDNIDITKCDVVLLGVLAESLYEKYYASRDAQQGKT